MVATNGSLSLDMAATNGSLSQDMAATNGSFRLGTVVLCMGITILEEVQDLAVGGGGFKSGAGEMNLIHNGEEGHQGVGAGEHKLVGEGGREGTGAAVILGPPLKEDNWLRAFHLLV